MDMMFDKDKRSIPVVDSTLDVNTIPNDIVDIVWGEHRFLADQMPQSWKKYKEEVELRVEIQREDGTFHKIDRTLRFVGGIHMICPPDTPNYGFRVSLPAHHELVAEYVAYQRQVDEVKQRWNKVSEEIVKFLQNCKSLNEALKLWPDVRIYIPNEFIVRVEHKAERSAATSTALDVLKSIDTDGAVAAAVGARLAAARSQS
jgi:hypothetical protein